MKTWALSAVVVSLLVFHGAASRAANHADVNHRHMGSTVDSRELVPFPPPMVVHQLEHMRGHLQALGEILSAMAVRDYARAAQVADTRLGLNSATAAACKSAAADDKAQTPVAPNQMMAMMAGYMPEGMRAIGFEMHSSASDFAALAAKLKPGDDDTTALQALSRVTGNCVACHAAYRTR